MSCHRAQGTRTRRTRQRSQEGSDDDIIETSSTTCIDLTVNESAEEIIDLTRLHGIMDSPVVVLTQADDIGANRRRRGGGRLGLRRSRSARRTRSTGVSSRHATTPPSVHILPDSDSDELPDLLLEVSAPNATSQSLLQSSGSVKISCPVCFDDIKTMKNHHKQVMSTVCGHIFCNICIKSAIKNQRNCPTCRKKLGLRDIHPVFL